MRQPFMRALVCIGALFLSSTAAAQNPAFHVALTNMHWWEANEDVSVDVVLAATHPGVEGFWLGICMSDSRLHGTGIQLLPALQAMHGGLGPDVFLLDVDPIGGSGVTCGTIFAHDGSVSLGVVSHLPVLRMTYTADLLPITEVVQLSFCDTLGGASFITEVIVGGQSQIPVTTGTLVHYTGPTTPPFIRGDANSNGSVDIADVVSILSHLFSAGVAPCRSALDTNTDGALNISDAIEVLSFLYDNGPMLSSPYPGCGPAGDTMGCASYTSCP